jgi:protein involved in polysaccharide export with SLBB domain
MNIQTDMILNCKATQEPWRSLPKNLKILNHGCLAAMLFLFACVTFVGCKTSHEDVVAAGSPNYSTNCLAEGDVVSITFQYSTNFNTVQKIGLDKMLNLQGAGQVKAAGESALQLQDQLTELYKTQAKDDPIIVRVVSTEACVYVIGAVNHPGRIPIVRPMTVIEAIMEAGGFDSDRAKLSQVWVLRIEEGRQRAYQLNLKEVLEGKDDKIFYVKPFDIVRVPTKTFNY